jgi:hypothetical protein
MESHGSIRLIHWQDLFLVCDDTNGQDKFFQICVNKKSEGFSLAQSGKLPSGVQAVSFGDIGRSGPLPQLFVSNEAFSQTAMAPLTWCFLPVPPSPRQLAWVETATSILLIISNYPCALPRQDPSWETGGGNAGSRMNCAMRIPISDLIFQNESITRHVLSTPRPAHF